MSQSPTASLSIVVPTTGKQRNLTRLLSSLVHGAPSSLLSFSELVVYVNEDPENPIERSSIQALIDSYSAPFVKVTTSWSSEFHLTAEKSAFEATKFATAPFLWILGDARSLLPEGLLELANFLADPPTPIAYFNSIWYSSDGKTSGYSSTLQLHAQCRLTFKEFVCSSGINFMATNMGSWIVQRKCLDHEIWAEIMAKCGPHFSHVTALLASAGSQLVTSHSVYLHVIEAKAYHSGSADEWRRYSKLSKTYRFYAWSLGLVRQFDYLIRRGVYDYSDVRRSMCSEGPLLRRQLDEIYLHVLSQIRTGWGYSSEQFSESEFNEIFEFLRRSAPERVIVNYRLADLYRNAKRLRDSEFFSQFQSVLRAVTIDDGDLRLVSLIVGQIGTNYIRLHPRGYVLSPVQDNTEFISAYHLMDFAGSRRVQLITAGEFSSARKLSVMLTPEMLFPTHRVAAPRATLSRRYLGALVRYLYKYRLTVRLVGHLPESVRFRLKRAIL